MRNKLNVFDAASISVFVLLDVSLFLIHVFELQNNRSKSRISSVVEASTSMLECTSHMCPIRVHWHVKANYKEYWRVKITVTNFNYRKNFTQWTLVAQHPNLNNVTRVYSFLYKSFMLFNTISKSKVQENPPYMVSFICV